LNTGNADVPANLRYRSLMLNQCNGYRSFLESFKHGTVISSWATVASSKTTRTYFRGLLDGVHNREPKPRPAVASGREGQDEGPGNTLFPLWIGGSILLVACLLLILRKFRKPSVD
jgi:hypothetical protein